MQFLIDSLLHDAVKRLKRKSWTQLRVYQRQLFPRSLKSCFQSLNNLLERKTPRSLKRIWASVTLYRVENNSHGSHAIFIVGLRLSFRTINKFNNSHGCIITWAITDFQYTCVSAWPSRVAWAKVCKQFTNSSFVA